MYRRPPLPAGRLMPSPPHALPPRLARPPEAGAESDADHVETDSPRTYPNPETIPGSLCRLVSRPNPLSPPPPPPSCGFAWSYTSRLNLLSRLVVLLALSANQRRPPRRTPRRPVAAPCPAPRSRPHVAPSKFKSPMRYTRFMGFVSLNVPPASRPRLERLAKLPVPRRARCFL